MLKSIFKIIILLFPLTIFSCGPKKNISKNKFISKHTYAVFTDINNPSTFDESALGDIPKKMNLDEFMTPVKDQSDRGTCAAFAAMALVESAIKKKMNIEVNLSEEYSNYSTKRNGYFSQIDSGTVLTNLYTGISDKKDFLLEKDWPYQPLWFGLAEKCLPYEVDDEKAPFECYSHNAPPSHIMTKKISGIHFKLIHKDKITTNDIILELAINKRPMSISFPVNERGWKINGDVEYSDEMRNECIKTPRSCGTHAVVLTGYDLNKKIFYFKNSWGQYWGQGGYGTLTIDMIDRYSEHSSLIVELKNNIDMASDHNKSELSFEKFDVSLIDSLNDQSKKINSNVLFKNIGFNTVKIDSILVMTPDYVTGGINDLNAQVVPLNLEDQIKFQSLGIMGKNIFLPTSGVGDFVIENESKGEINISSDLMSSNTIKDLVFKQKKLYFKTSLYIYSDDDGYKVLKSYYHEVNML